MSTTKPWGLLAQYENPAAVFHACETVRDAGYQSWDACTPFPVHGLDKAMGLKSSKLPWAVLAVGVTGSSLALFFQSWAMGNAYPFIVGGKPLFSLPAFVPIWYELTVLSSCVTAFLANWIINGLPQPYHPAFASKAFERVTDDKFFIMIESSDPKFDLEATRALLKKTGATLVEELQP
ncbi:MAG: DUF3341 domain-containing protein [Deltaproteobacteria bacterium]|nr:DUF3341 domain-containing protein [Deltaproteobacteria bacterium]